MHENDAQELDMPPAGFSRAGDFAYCGFAGIIAVISGQMLGPMGSGGGLAIILVFIAALAMRYLTLKDAKPVPVGVNVPKEQFENLKRQRALMNALPQPVMLLNKDGVVEMFNPACADTFGNDIGGGHISSVIRAPKALKVLEAAHKSGGPEEAEFSTTGVNARTSLFYAAPLGGDEDDPSDSMIVMVRDRTEQKKLERMRTDFVANASHELRTPLASMMGFIETLQHHAKDDEAARQRFLGIMAGQAERMLSLVEDLIGLSAIELNETNPPSEKVELSSITREVCESLMPMAEKTKAVLGCSLCESDLAVTGDRHELFRLFQNLCDNAIKYGESEEDGRAHITLSVGEGAPSQREGSMRAGDTASQIAVRAEVSVEELVWVRIEDRGPGIDQNDLPRLTERFYRVNPELSRSKGGTGLGLAIVKHIIQRHKGGLQIESVPGEGASFTCIFPRYNLTNTNGG